MSTQLEFIMQLYMMNLLQQQQQQQQQQHQQFAQQSSPNKLKDSISSTAAAPAAAPAATSPIPRQKQPKKSQTNSRAQKQRKNSLNTNTNTNCSSSSSCSPNSNSSPISAHLISPTMPPFPQMLFNQLSTLTSTPSKLPLTPTTPNSNAFSSASAAALTAAHGMPPSTMTDYLCGSQAIPFPPPSVDTSFTANNFLQSSTVTSTPTQKGSALAQQDSSRLSGADVDDEEKEDEEYDEEEEEDVVKVEEAASFNRLVTSNVEERLSGHLAKQTIDVVEDLDEDEDDDEEEEELPLSSLHSSSGVASTSAGSMENSAKLLLCSGVQATLESTDSFDSPHNMPYTPIKQEADSSFSTQLPMSLTKDSAIGRSSSVLHHTLADAEDSNVTPLSLATTMLTPPSSEQLMSAPKFESTQGISLSTASGLDAFLQNEENLKNLKKFSSYLECENMLCRQENMREHFHCFDEPCNGKILSKRDDIIRHLKWHKKRKDSLVLGFARFSKWDDCAPSYGAGCAHNWKKTHYHCVYEDCPKVYVSTSDVEMHAKSHRTNSEIVQEGFRRYRAHENCKIEDCPFYGKEKSHYHCCREGCNYTFKNKADMEKHKKYHLNNQQLTQDGFKKILKTEVCPFEACKFSTVCNHTHCVRENCNYILHSSSQLSSHKRRHDRLDGEQAYQKFKKEKDSSEEESPALPLATSAVEQQQQQQQQHNVSVSTPLSSLSADHFLARKRGRPPKKIQLPTELQEAKRIKLEPCSSSNDQVVNSANATATTAMSSSMPPGMFPPFLPNFNPAAAAAAAAAAQNMQTPQDPNAPNFQLTHLMALFQLQNPLFYQNLYPGSMTAAANMANMLGAMPQPQNNAGVFGNLAAFGAGAGAAIKPEFSDKQEFKE